MRHSKQHLTNRIFDVQTEETAAAMARAWLKVTAEVREQGWPTFTESAAATSALSQRVAFFSR